MKRSGRNKSALIVAAVLGAGAMLAAAGCSSKKGGEIRAEGETTIISSPTKTAAEYTPEENAYVLAGKLKSLTSYRTEVSGEVSAGFGPINYKQTISDTHIKNGEESFLQAKSTSALVNVGKQAFFKGDKVVMRDASDVKKDVWSDTFSVTTLSDYRTNLGAEPTALSNYILNDETIVKAEKVSVTDDVYTFRYEIDPVKGTSRYAVKMMNYGGLKNKPEYQSCVLEVTFGKDWLPISLKAEDKYKINLIGDMSCTSTLTETFYDVGGQTEIPLAEMFREKLGDDPADIDPEDTEDKDGLSALADAVLNTDLSGGLKIRGSLAADMGESKLPELPVDAWLSFDLAKFAFQGLSGAFRARISTEVMGVPAELLYTGDGWLYTAVGSTRYKYELPDLGDGMDLQAVLGLFTAEKLPQNGNTYRYKLTLNASILDTANAAIADFAAGLSGPAKDLFGALSLSEVSATISVHKGPQDAGTISAVELFADFDAASLKADVSVSEVAETLPSAEELAVYTAGDAAKLAENFGSLFEIAGKLTDLDWTTGMNITLNVGLDSDTADAPLLLPLDTQLQILPEELLSGNILGALRFRASLNLFIVNIELYYENGMLYMINTKQKDGQTYATSVTSVNVVDSVLGLLSNALLPNGSPSVAATAEGFDLIAVLADAAMNANVETTRNDETDSTRIQINMSQNFTSLLNTGYHMLLEAVQGIDLGEMQELLGAILSLFDFEIDRACVRADFVGGALSDVSFRLINDGTSAVLPGSDLAFVLGVTMGEAMAAGEIDKVFEALQGHLAAYEEGTAVREAVEKLKADGVRYLGDSYKALLDETAAAYDRLSVAAQYTVDYSGLTDLIKDFDTLRAPVDELLEYIVKLRKEGKAEDYEKAAEIYDEKISDPRQLEYLGRFAEEEYLELRREYEKDVVVPALNEELSKLDRTNYPDASDLITAAAKAEAVYEDLLAESKALVTDYEAIEAARQAVAPDVPAAFVAAVAAIGPVEEITAGAETYAKILKAQTLRDFMLKNMDASALQAADVAAADTTFTACKQQHRTLETALVNGLISAIGKVAFTDECHGLIVAAREAFNALPEEYKNFCSKRYTLAYAEADYVKLAIAAIDADNLTLGDKAKVELARRLYDEATAAYGKNALATTINNRLGDSEATLKALEKAIAELEAAA